MTKHKNDGKCAHCQLIFDRYPGFYEPLREWFEFFQSEHPEGHVSCAGRGQIDQEALFEKNATRAHFGESAHNYNAAIDIFEMGGQDSKDIYEINWFYDVLAASLPDFVSWYGSIGSRFFEMPHIEVKNWKVLLEEGKLNLV